MSVAALHAGSESSATPPAPTDSPQIQAGSPGRRDASAAEPEPEVQRLDPRLTHLLRLSLDLQLDAMLFTLGVAATHDDSPDVTLEAIDLTTPVPSATSTDEAAVPWRRWMTEDLELTRRLASTAAELGVALPPTLGRADRHPDSRGIAEDLIARYEFMANLLGDLLDRAVVSTPNSLLEPVHDALSRSHSRLIELRTASSISRRP